MRHMCCEGSADATDLEWNAPLVIDAQDKSNDNEGHMSKV